MTATPPTNSPPGAVVIDGSIAVAIAAKETGEPTASAEIHHYLVNGNGEKSLVLRAEAIRTTYTCRRSADGIYIALAEELTATRPTVLLTFDKDMPNQIAKNAPTVSVQLLTV